MICMRQDDGAVMLLNLSFGHARAGADGRRRGPPFLIFASAGYYRDGAFSGLLYRAKRACPLLKTLSVFGNHRPASAFRIIAQSSRC